MGMHVTSKARCLAQDWKEFLGSEEDRNTKHKKMVTDSIRANLIQPLYYLVSSWVSRPMIHTLTPGTGQTKGYVQAKEGAVQGRTAAISLSVPNNVGVRRSSGGGATLCSLGCGSGSGSFLGAPPFVSSGYCFEYIDDDVEEEEEEEEELYASVVRNKLG
ncbi:hypothetical protein OIU74_006941 [Salix koriyanagi]|uniref:Uncharacterized protein n=1 Tax=Salix koriyanagi TaxID=2511006 RepID=A0A9Q0U2H5_9ROSI|nr:hypothetical protein OIU74_006941 [Salix koriyanagi]